MTTWPQVLCGHLDSGLGVGGWIPVDSWSNSTQLDQRSDVASGEAEPPQDVAVTDAADVADVAEPDDGEADSGYTRGMKCVKIEAQWNGRGNQHFVS